MNASHHNPDLWIETMGRAALMPPDDPERQAVEAEVARRGGVAQAHWLALLEEGERLRLALADVEVPERLVAGLLELPGQDRGWTGVLGGGRRRWLAAAIAAVLLVAVGWLALRPPAAREAKGLEEVALLAVKDHLDTHAWEVEASEPEALARGLQPRIPFPVRLPALGEGFQPVGGRRCKLGHHPVAFTAWRGPRGRLTLLQLRRDDYGLEADLAPTRVHRGEPGTSVRPLDSLFFGEGEFTWVVVADDPRDLDDVERAVRAREGR